MEYKELINLENQEVTDVIQIMIKIYKNIQNKKMMYKKYNQYKVFNKFDLKKLSDTDKKCVALFFACIFISNDIEDILHTYNIDKSMLLKYFKVKNSLTNNYLTNKEYEECYNSNFKLYVSRIIRAIDEKSFSKMSVSP